MAVFYRLIKPNWGKPFLTKRVDGEIIKIDNPDFVREIHGQDVIEGKDFTPEYLKSMNHAGYNVYFFPNHPSEDVYAKEKIRHLSGKHIDVFEYVFVDMDLKDGIYKDKETFLNTLSEFPVKPSLTVISGNGVHSYWKIKDLKRETFVALQRGLIKYFNTDDSIWTVLQLMRVPLSLNTKKHDEFKQTEIHKDLSCGKLYTAQELLNIVGNLLTKEDLKKCQDHLDKIDGKLVANVSLNEVDLSKLPAKFEALLETNPKVNTLFYSPREVVSDRSAADMKLANILFSEGFNINEATQVLSLTEKAKEKGSSALDYALNTVGKVYSDRPKHKFQTVSQFIKERGTSIQEPTVNGPYYMDYGVLAEPWRKKELLGLIGGSGSGKTAIALNIIRDIIQQNHHNDEVFVFFSLEMTAGQIIERWINLVGKDSPHADRFYVIDTENGGSSQAQLGLQEIEECCKEIMQVTGKKIGTLVIDHFHIISKHIDTSKKNTFGIDSVHGAGHGKIRQLLPNDMATQLKNLVKSLDTFGIILAQTTKEKGVGDTPIGKDGAYGISQFEWIVDRIITIWQPLLRATDQTNLRFLSFQYAKIREKRPEDRIRELEPKLLTYDLKSGSLSVPTHDEYQEFMRVLPIAIERRKDAEKKKSPQYAIQVDISALKSLVLEKKVKL